MDEGDTPCNSLGLQVDKQYLLWGLKSINSTYFGPFGVLGIEGFQSTLNQRDDLQTLVFCRLGVEALLRGDTSHDLVPKSFSFKFFSKRKGRKTNKR